MAKAKEAEPSDDVAAEVEVEAEPAGAKRTFPLKLIIMAAAAVLVVGGGGTAAFLMFGGKQHDESKQLEAPGKPVAFMELPDVVVNLANSGGGERTQYLKIKIVLEVPDQLIANQIQPLMPRVVDAFQTYLRELRSTDLEGSGGLYRLRDELTRRVNLAISPYRINAVLFKEIIVQ